MATTKRKKRKRRGGEGTASRGNTMANMRGGLKGLVGQGKRRSKESTLSKVFSYLLLAAAVGLLIYRFTR